MNASARSEYNSPWWLGFVGALSLLLLLGSGPAIHVSAATLHYDWSVDYARPDCVDKQIIAINGGFPGPTIIATVNDTLVVRVTNSLPTEGVVIHYRGLHQFGTPFYDGAAFVSQCPINPGETFTYKFNVGNRAGTYFYHGHLGLQRVAGLFGSLIVKLPPGKAEPFAYDEELSVVVNDWYYKSIYEQEQGLMGIPFHFVGSPDTLLITGGRYYNCSVRALSVQYGKTYLLRITSVASLASLNFMLEGHNMTVVQADSRYVEPFTVDNIDIYSGQTYNVLFSATQDPARNYWVGLNMRGRNPVNTTKGLAILQYLPMPSFPLTPTPVSPLWNDTTSSIAFVQKVLARQGYEPPPPPVSDRKLVLMTTQNNISAHIRWSLNNVSYVSTATPILAALKRNIKHAFSAHPPPDRPPRNYNISEPQTLNPSHIPATFGNGVYIFKLGAVVDVVIQNAITLANNSEIHPWHLHGHDFWVLGYGEGRFNETTDPLKFNLVNPPSRNTVAVFPYGWVALRFVANNPGAWGFHCHLEAHVQMGMATVFAEGIHKLPRIPKETLGCGLTKL